MVKIKPGMTDDYLKGIAKTFKGELEEAEKQNLIMDYKVPIGEAATPQDFDILLMVESPNMAALDNARESSTRSPTRSGAVSINSVRRRRSVSTFARSWAPNSCAKSR
ncbi:MAG: hypothetical protein H0X34_03835 [Chthoniobacterales bacterium]|nr:hypothetical protein [Chthoniobacterales bacterium]